mgnify:CR=1 FL=1
MMTQKSFLRASLIGTALSFAAGAAMAAIALGWAVLTPLLLRVARRI